MNTLKAHLITIGDEILYGQTIDTNAHWIGQQFNQIGIRVIKKSTVGDTREDILSVLNENKDVADITVLTGGLGPTKDDITKKTIAEFFNTSLNFDQQVFEQVKAYFQKRNRTMNALNESQAEIPENCTPITNSVGTAPGMWFHENGKIWVSMPGVPYEMKQMVTDEIIPRIKKTFRLPAIYHSIIKTVGIGESWISEILEEWENELPKHITFAYLPGLGQVKLRITGFGRDYNTIKQEVQQYSNKLIPYIKPYIYGYDDITLEEAIGRLLKDNNKTMALAESCTGGYVAHCITSIPGSSAYFKGGIIPYSNEMKESLLGVNKSTLERYGAVSQQTVEEMAQQIRVKFNADYGLATSGIAGPGGGTSDKPVGTVWIGYADQHQTQSKLLNLAQGRTVNIQFTAVALMNLLRKHIQEIQ